MTVGLPLLSVFTALYNTGDRLFRAFESVVTQSYPRWEWVLVDDSTTKDTAVLIERVLEDPRVAGRIRYLRQSPTLGSIGAVKATAAGAAFGEILVELDHDDELLPDALEILAATFIAHPEIDVAYSDWIDWIDDDGDGGDGVSGTFPSGWAFGFGAHASEMVRGRRADVELAPPLTWETVRHIVSTPNHVRAWRAAFYHQIGGHDPALQVADDYDLIVRSFLAGRLARIPRPLYVQHHGADQANASRRFNSRIQHHVALIAGRQRAALNRRCVELGVSPPSPDALTSPERTIFANAMIDVVAEASTDLGPPLVSVIIPTFRRPALLAAAVGSVLAQDHPALDVIVVGDGCPDVDGVMRSIDDPRVRHTNLAANHGDGGAAARNFGLRTMCRADLVAYLDDDNTWAPDHVSSLVQALASTPGAMFAFASFYLNDEPIVARLPVRYQIDTSALIHRRSLLDRFGYWQPADAADGAHDWELVSRWRGQTWVATGRPTLRYTVAPERHSPELLDTIRAVARAADAATHDGHRA